MLGRFTRPDPNTKFSLVNPQSLNRYSYVLNNPVIHTDPTGETVYVVTYTTGNSDGDDELKAAAETKADELRNAKGFDPTSDRVILRGVQTKQDFAAVLKEARSLEKAFGKVGQLSLFSHAGKRDGPTFQYGTPQRHWFSRSDVASMAVNWNTGARANFFGCNTALKFGPAFAKAQGVVTNGFTDYALFSSSPDRFTYPLRDSDPLYMIQTYGGLLPTMFGLSPDQAIPMMPSRP